MKSPAHQILILYLFLLVFPANAAKKPEKVRPWKIRQVVFTGNETFKRFELLQVMDLRPVFMKTGRRSIT
jgi:hypothetical protein